MWDGQDYLCVIHFGLKHRYLATIVGHDSWQQEAKGKPTLIN
ncbi:hypothetical protein PALI_a0443 [Pseudoalteromonas aliena SW19]|uniref:Transposase n=1 Tax=Pseudoalteromonas aliena SW19 TaxID=1314866 RepID=A0ABR9DYJ6_9GAMM|nr:hypothetical protein [Pseudoalteromonas aliena SW19]